MSFLVRRCGEKGNYGVDENKGRFGITNIALVRAFDLAMDYGWDPNENTSVNEEWPNMNYEIKNVDKLVKALKLGLGIHQNHEYHTYLTSFVDWMESFDDDELFALQ